MWLRWLLLRLLYGRAWRTFAALEARLDALGWSSSEAHGNAYWHLDRAELAHPDWIVAARRQQATDRLLAMMPRHDVDLARVLIALAAERVMVERAG